MRRFILAAGYAALWRIDRLKTLFLVKSGEP